MSFKNSALIAFFAALVGSPVAQAASPLSGTVTTTTHRFDLDVPTGALGSCGYPWGDLDISAITAYEGNGAKDYCGMCVKICADADPNRCKNFMIVDTGGRPLDISSVGIKQMFPGTTDANLGLYKISYQTVPSSECASVYKGAVSNTFTAAADPVSPAPVQEPAAKDPAPVQEPAPKEPAVKVQDPVVQPPPATSSTPPAPVISEAPAAQPDAAPVTPPQSSSASQPAASSSNEPASTPVVVPDATKASPPVQTVLTAPISIVYNDDECSKFNFNVSVGSNENTTDMVYMDFVDSDNIYAFKINDTATNYTAVNEDLISNVSAYNWMTTGSSICMNITNVTLNSSSVARCLVNETVNFAGVPKICVNTTEIFAKNENATFCAGFTNVWTAMNVFDACLSNTTATAQKYPVPQQKTALVKRDFIANFFSRVNRRV